MAHISEELHNMMAGPAASAAIQTIYKSEDGIMLCYGTAAYTVLEADTVYAPGCIYIKVVAAGPSIWYGNQGTAASPDFDTFTVA